jgi:hypothetical protein
VFARQSGAHLWLPVLAVRPGRQVRLTPAGARPERSAGNSNWDTVLPGYATCVLQHFWDHLRGFAALLQGGGGGPALVVLQTPAARG